MNIKKLIDDLKFDVSTLDEQMIRHPGLYAWYATKQAASERAAIMAKVRLDQAKAAARKEARSETFGQKVTLEAINDEIMFDAQVISAFENHASAKSELEFYKGACESLRAKKDLMINAAKSALQEKLSTPRVT